MDKIPTFSIVITSYNYGHFLVNALESVLLQKRPDTQVLLIDDASTDDTPQIAAKYSDHIQYVRNKNNLGASGAWAAGIALAKGKYLIKLDADDEFLPGHLDALERAFESDADVGMVFASVLTKSEPDGVMKPEHIVDEDQILSAACFRKKLLECFLYRMPGCALRRAVTVGKEEPDPELFQIHDWEYFLRVTDGYKAKLLREPSAVYRIHTSSISSVARYDNRLYKDVRHWLEIAKVPGQRYINEEDRKILIGSCACLLLFGFGSKLNPMSYIRFIPIYLRTLKLATGGGSDQVKRMHQALFQRATEKSKELS
ncbi:MAG: glycosyltransferase family 2 protein [Xanthomonadales bacterium]|nr:glycosyltransferase family 2 protein [Xanthomonadales bacterium]